MKKFKDSSTAPIIAWDFDGTLNVGGEHIYPLCGFLRPYAKQVLTFLHNIGVKNVIWTSRDVSIDQDSLSTHDDITYAIDFLNSFGVPFDAINKSVQFAPYKYNSRKVYAHMYVDDRGYGWQDHEHILIYVLDEFLYNILDIDLRVRCDIWDAIQNGKEVQAENVNICRSVVERWNK